MEVKTSIVLILILLSTGCASRGGYMLPDSDGASQAPGHAFTGDGMMFRKEQPGHQDDPEFDFYYKHCSTNGNEAYYSKTSYDCSGPLAR